MSFKVHLIHDLNYGFNEPTEAADLELPDCDLVILNGNLAQSIVNAVRYYAFELCARYTPTYNLFTMKVTKKDI